MPLIALRQARNRQPQIRTELDWGNPINRGLVEAYNWGAGKVDLVASRVATTDYALINAADQAGRAAKFSAEKHVITGQTWAGATEWTFLTLALPDTSKTAAISFANGVGAAGQSYLLFNTTSGFGASAGYVGFGSGSAAGSAVVTAVASAIRPYPAVYVGTQSDQRRVFRDGVLLGTGSSGAVTIAGTGHVTCLNGIQGYSGYNSSASKYFLTMIWNRALSPEEIAAIGANPWQLFRPQERSIWVPSAGGGGAVSLVIADATHAHTADGLTLTLQSALSVADATHGHAADNLTLTTTGSTSLTVADATHAHTADSPTLTVLAVLSVADALHGHSAANVTLGVSGATTLTVADATHSHLVDGLVLTTESLLTVADALHAHAADNVDLSDAPILQIADALHAHTADGLALTVDAWLAVADARHLHSADNVVLFVPGGATLREVLRLPSPICRSVTAASYITRTVTGQSAIDIESTT